MESHDPRDYEPFYNLSLAKTYKVSLGMAWVVFKRLFRKRYHCVIFYGAECWLSLAVQKKILRTKTPMFYNSNGLETRYLDTMNKMFGTISYDQKPIKWYTIDPRPFYHKAFRWCDGIITNNEMDRKYSIEKKYQPENRIINAEYGLDPSFLNVASEFKNTKILGFCGTWIKRKGVDILASTAEKILLERTDYQLYLIGVGASFDKNAVFKSSVSNRVMVFPVIEDKLELIKIYKEISIFVFPSHYESFGLVIAEAMACGAALVASSTGFSSSLNDDEGLIIDQPTSDTLYQGVMTLIQNEERRFFLAKNGYGRSQRLNWDLVVTRMERAYLHWIDSTAGIA